MIKFLDAILAICVLSATMPFARMTQWLRDRRRQALLEAVYSDIERANKG